MKQYWIAQCIPYYAIFDLDGKLIAFVDTESCTYIRPRKSNVLDKIIFRYDDNYELIYSYDLAQLSIDQIIEYGKAHIGQAFLYTKYLGDYFKTEQPTIEKTYTNAIEIANKEFSHSTYDDEFVVYTNHANDAWIVRCNVWVAVFSKDTGELVFIDTLGTADTSYRLDN